ncbi:IS21 family transposase [Streptomyces sp. NPDC004327]|uniref:Mu transposase domain-containing protein n=1 Tax=Streptomyces sp. NPDC004327 TaxID=3364699 RepID=UPI003695327B
MLTRGEYLEMRELRRKGWSISAIARHLGRDRKTVRSYLGGDRVAGVRSPALDVSLLFLPYCRQRLADDPHLLASRLFAEVVELGYPGGYSTFTRALRRHLLRPPCAECRPDAHPDGPADVPEDAGQEIRFDWLRLPAPPLRWGCGTHARLLVGTETASGRWRGVLSDGDDLPHLTEAIDRTLRRLGGTPRRWRLDRTPVVCTIATGWPNPAFAQVARYYGAAVRLGPADPADPPDEARGAALRDWWNAIGHDSRLAGAQDELDRLAAGQEAPDGPRPAALPALPPTPFPAWLRARRIVGPQGLVPYRDSYYAVQPDLAGSRVEVHRRLDNPYLSIATPKGAVIARHRLAPPGTARTLADGAGACALERPVRPAHSQGPACRGGRGVRPPSRQALAEARALRARLAADGAVEAAVDEAADEAVDEVGDEAADEAVDEVGEEALDEVGDVRGDGRVGAREAAGAGPEFEVPERS